MARDKIQVQLPVIGNTTAIGTLTLTETTVVQANGITIEKPLECMNNTLVILVKNTAQTDSSITVKNGDHYPNAILGDLTVPVTTAKTTVLQIQDPSRFVNADGDINVDFATGFTGTICSIGKDIGI